MNFIIDQEIADSNKLRFTTQSTSTVEDEAELTLQPPAAPKLKAQKPVLELNQFTLPSPAN